MPTERYIDYTSRGTGSGNTPENAATIGDINNQINLAKAGGAGGRVIILPGAHIKVTNLPTITTGGNDEANRVTIGGLTPLDGRPGEPIYVEGNRRYPFNSLDADTSSGGSGFKLSNGAQYLTFTNIVFRDIGSAFETVSGYQALGITVENCVAENVRRFIYGVTGGQAWGEGGFKNFIFRNLYGKGFSKGFISLNKGNEDGVIENVHIDSNEQQGDAWAAGIKIGPVNESDAIGNRNIVIRNCSARGIRDEVEAAQSYHNGDFISTERKDTNIHVYDCYGENIEDAVIDMKSTASTITRSGGRNCKRTFKLWASDLKCYDIYSYAPQAKSTYGLGAGSSGTSAMHCFVGDGGFQIYGGIFDNEGFDTERFGRDTGNPVPDLTFVNGNFILRSKTSDTAYGPSSLFVRVGPRVRQERIY